MFFVRWRNAYVQIPPVALESPFSSCIARALLEKGGRRAEKKWTNRNVHCIQPGVVFFSHVYDKFSAGGVNGMEYSSLILKMSFQSCCISTSIDHPRPVNF